MLATLAFAGASFALLAVVFFPLERAFPARARQRFFRREWATDACFFFGQYLLWSAIAIAALGSVHTVIGRRPPLPIPLFAQGVVAIVLGDFLVYWFHRACHRFEVLWRFHAVHHSTRELDWLAAHREHPLDGLATQLCQNLPAMLLGVPIQALAVIAVFRGAWGIFIHSNVRLPLGPLSFVLGAPELHHWHHARLEKTQHNFANLAPWLDVVFGTYHRPAEVEETYELGLTEPWPRGYVAQLLRPFAPAQSTRTTSTSSMPFSGSTSTTRK
jgi:sterol desaturase/sphingolipid hydroxylase (fatty acid hydroxylase superfamily)